MSEWYSPTVRCFHRNDALDAGAVTPLYLTSADG